MILNLFNKFNKVGDGVYVVGIKITNSTSISNQTSLPITRLTQITDPYGLVTVDNTGPGIFNDIPPWRDMIEWNITANGPEFSQNDTNFSRQNNTFVHIPEFYYYRVVTSTDIYYYVSNVQFNSSFLRHPGSGRYVSKYMLDSSNLSISGNYADYYVYYETESYYSVVSTFCENVTPTNSNYTTSTGIYVPFDIHTLYAIVLLYIIEYGRWNYMLTLDNENFETETDIVPAEATLDPNGSTDVLTSSTGWAFRCALYNRDTYSFKYREIEDLILANYTPATILVSGIRMSLDMITINQDPQYYTSISSNNYTAAVNHNVFNNLTGNEVGGYAHSLLTWQNPNLDWLFLPGEVGAVKASYTYTSGKPTNVSPISKPAFDVINNVFYNMKGTSSASSSNAHNIFLGSAGTKNGSIKAIYPSILSYGVGLRGGVYYGNPPTQNSSYLYKRSVFIPNSSLS